MKAEERGMRVTATAEQALAAMDHDAGMLGDPDRWDLARLLSAVGAAWTAAAERASAHERERWAEVCDLAERIAIDLGRELRQFDATGICSVSPIRKAT